ncbi:MAG TPA: peptidoglycan DD-metalloendopeptidase family protein [Cyclobacteriaceae bacterium]|nr:peptidoglycan DD-metalloendopeptidase family protein [Cyclobacteriaceae bacterium]
MKFFRRSLIILGSLLVIFGVLIVFDNVSQYTSFDDDIAVDTTSVPQFVPQPTRLFGMVVDGLEIVSAEVKRNQRFSDLLDGYHVDGKALRLLAMIPRNVFDFRKVAAHRKYTLITDTDSVKTARALVYEANPVDYVVFHFSDTLIVETCSRETATVERSIAAEIKSNLSETIESMNISHELTNGFVDIFAWQVDFQRLQKGDKFKLIYTERQVEGKPVGIEEIKGVYFEHFGSPYYAFPFEQNESTDYFDEKGNSLRKALLKYPIEFTRISSRFNPNRFHPVAKVFRAHKGTDFAAPTGTPIRSAGDGIVLEAQYRGGNGNYVKIRHNATYTTQYLHMSKIGNGVRAGARVHQGQTIGYVGSTGLANGPHLCYRFWKNGVQVDALKVQLPAAQPIGDADRPAFDIVKETLIKRLDAIPFPVEPAEIAAVTN